MTRTKFLLFLLASLFITSLLNAQVIDITTVSFEEVDKLVSQKNKQYGISEVLVILDIDNTILTSQEDLGGDIWYQWQRGELEDIKPTEEQKIKNCFYEDVIGLLYELGTMELTDSLLPNYISNWQSAGTPVFALTSRSPKYRTATERELIKRGIDFSLSPLKTIEGETPTYDYKLQRDMSYQNGIMMTTGMNKGEMIAHILGRTGRSFKAIIFVDDSEKNVKNVRLEYQDNPDIDFTIFHYDKIVRDRIIANGGVIVTPKQAKKMAKDWNELNDTLNCIFPGRNIKNKCVCSD